jgi:uncharacterized delta-60 repeat protein
MARVLRTMALQSDGKIVAAGNWDGRFYLTRFNTDGSVDSSFGDSGVVITNQGIDVDSVTIMHDGRIFAAGYGEGMSSTLAVYESSGNLHALFSKKYKEYNVSMGVSPTQDGGALVSTYTTTFPADGTNAAESIGVSKYKNNAEIWSTVIGNNIPNYYAFAREKTDSKILVAATIATKGLTNDDGTDWNAIAYQLNADGSHDTSFGTNGTAIISYVGRERVFSSELGPSNNAYFVGYIDLDPDPIGWYPTENTNFYASSLLADGRLNTAFGGGDAVATINFGGKDVAQASAIQKDNKLILAGLTNTTGKEALALARLNTDGSLDLTFGNKGTVVVSGLDKNADWFEVTDVLVRDDGDIIALFTTGNASASIAFDKTGKIKLGYTVGSDSSDDFLTSPVLVDSNGDSNDTVNGGLSDDLIIGGDGKGNDRYYGGAGEDTVKYTSATWGITVDLSRGTAASLTNPNLRGNRDAANIGADRLYEIENVTAGNYNDVLSGNQLANEIKGEDGDDRIDGKSGNDVLYGGAGNDSLTGGTGADVMLGGAGDDVYDVDSLSDVVTELVGQGIDTIRTQLRSYTLGNHVENVTYTGWLNSTLIGNSLDNQITGGRGADTLDGGGGNDTLIGGAGDDIYLLTSEHVGTVTIVEAARGGIDSVYGDLETYTLGSHLENYYNDLSIRNGNSIQYVVIHGNSLNNTLSTYETKESAEKFFGLAGNDTLLGGAGDDYLSGGIGRDRLTGGTGADKFVFDTTPNSRTNADIITDFSRSDGDELVFDDDVFTMLREGVTKDYLRINRTGRAQDADDYLVLNSTNGKLFYDADGNGRGAAIEIATLTGVNTLSHDDFFII